MSSRTPVFHQVSCDFNEYRPFLGTGRENPYLQYLKYASISIKYLIQIINILSCRPEIKSCSLILSLWFLSWSLLYSQCDIFTGSASITAPIPCNGSNAIVTMAASGGYTPYTFTFGSLPPVITNSPSQTFNVSSGNGYAWSISSEGCSNITGTLDITQPDPFDSVISATTPTCFNQSTGTATISGNGGTPPYLYSNDGINYDASPMRTGLAEGSITLFIMDNNACIYTISADIFSLSPLNSGAHNTDPITVCPNFNPGALIFIVPVSGGSPPYSYQWNLNGNPVDGAINPVYDPSNLLDPGNYVYNCTVTDECGQIENTSSKTITVVDEATITVSGGGAFCQNEPVTLTAEVTGGTGTIIYQWQQSPDNISWTSISGANDPVFNPPTGTTGQIYYRVDLTVNGAACNDPNSNSQTVTVNPLPVTSAIYHR
jgi:hypothetical protein